MNFFVLFFFFVNFLCVYATRICTSFSIVLHLTKHYTDPHPRSKRNKFKKKTYLKCIKDAKIILCVLGDWENVPPCVVYTTHNMRRTLASFTHFFLLFFGFFLYLSILPLLHLWMLGCCCCSMYAESISHYSFTYSPCVCVFF